jgi:hypothetical protein
MEVWTCRCHWTWVFAGKRVYGPIFEDKSAEAARVHKLKDWRENYYDCAALRVRQDV